MTKNNSSIETIIDAWELASRVHFGQRYATTNANQQREYLNHIGRVVLEIQQAVRQDTHVDADLAILSAILHDTIEDTEVTYEEIQQQFGLSVANGVLALTKNGGLKSKEEKMRDSLERIQQQPKEIWMVKMADRICNLQTPPHHWTKEKVGKYKKEATLIYETLRKGNDYLAARLKQKINAYGN